MTKHVNHKLYQAGLLVINSWFGKCEDCFSKCRILILGLIDGESMQRKQYSSYESLKEEPLSEAFEVSVTKTIVQRVQNIESKGPLERRCSPGLINTPQEKRPCYDDGQSMELDAPKLDICKKEVEEESTGPRERRPYYDGDQRWELNAPKHDECKKETRDYNRKRQLESTRDNAVKRRTCMNHSLQEWLPDIDRKGGEDWCDRSCLALGSLPFKVDEAEIDLEDTAFLKWTDYQNFVAEGLHSSEGDSEEF